MNEFIKLNREPILEYNDKKIIFPEDVSIAIENHWNELISEGKTFKRGDVFTVVKNKEENGEVMVELMLSDYAHYLTTIHGIIKGEYMCRVVHSSVMIETKDNFLVFGQMNSNTALPGRIQCIGGGITREDLKEDGKFIDISRNASNEMEEEIGISSTDNSRIESFLPWAVVQSGPQKFLGVVYWVKLSIDLEQLLSEYELFEKDILEKGEKPELAKLIYVTKNEQNKENLLNKDGSPFAEYLPIIFKNI